VTNNEKINNKYNNTTSIYKIFKKQKTQKSVGCLPSVLRFDTSLSTTGCTGNTLLDGQSAVRANFYGIMLLNL